MIDGRVFVTREIAPDALARLREEFAEVDVWEAFEPPTREQLAERAAGCVAVVTMISDRVDAALLNAAPTVKVVANMAVGYNNVDVATCSGRDVAVSNTPNVLEETTADLALALMLAAARHVVASDADTRAGNWGLWHPALWLGTDVYGATLGIVGMGAIGSAVARRARGFDMRILYTANNRRNGGRGRAGGRVRAGPEGAAGAIGLRVAARAADGVDAQPDRRGGTGGDAADGVPDKHLAGRRGGHGGAAGGAAGGTHRRGRAGRDGAGADPGGTIRCCRCRTWW